MLLNMTGGAYYEDGNEIAYPIIDPSQDNKLYKEADISAIASAIDSVGLTVSEMPEAIRHIHSSGMIATSIPIQLQTYTASDL